MKEVLIPIALAAKIFAVHPSSINRWVSQGHLNREHGQIITDRAFWQFAMRKARKLEARQVLCPETLPEVFRKK